MTGYILLAIVKVIDNVISTAKNICQYKEMKVLSSILTIISQLIFYLVISHVIEDNTFLSIVVVSVASGLGNYLAFLLNDKFKRDTKWVFIITSSNANDIQNICNSLVENDIKYIVNDGYTRKWQKTINLMAFSKSKDESRLIEEFLKKTENKYLKEII